MSYELLLFRLIILPETLQRYQSQLIISYVSVVKLHLKIISVIISWSPVSFRDVSERGE